MKTVLNTGVASTMAIISGKMKKRTSSIARKKSGISLISNCPCFGGARGKRLARAKPGGPFSGGAQCAKTQAVASAR